MSQAQQVAVAGPSTLASEASRPARSQQQNIPRFLLKLYEIINDPANEPLIKWSDAGDSFYIYNQERFARELLGKWFKHQNFSSFVRQLNLYGFRKISALQQGLLRMENDTETIQFAHPNFHRGQPDLLALIQRKRHPTTHSQMDDDAVSLLQASLSQGSRDEGSAVDIRSVVEGINAIRRQQQAISADLTTLKQSNDALWKEAIEAREKHAKHEDTINRILKFLAGLFGRAVQGRNGAQLHGHGDKTAAPPRRLLIGDGRLGHDEGQDFGSDADALSEPRSRGNSPFPVASERFATIETPGTSVTSPAPTVSEVADSVPKSPTKSPRTITEDLRKQTATGTSSVANPLPRPPIAASTSLANPAFEQSAPNAEAIWQATLQQILSAPEQFQRAVQAVANTPSYHIPMDAAPSPSALFAPTNPSQEQLTYPSFDYPAQQRPLPLSQAQSANPLAVSASQSPAPTRQDNDELNKIYRDPNEISADMDDLQSNIHALMCDIGLDPHNLTFPDVTQAPDSAGQASSTGTDGFGQGDADFSFDSWLNQLSNSSAPDEKDPDPSGEDLSAFLDIPAFDEPPSTQSGPSDSVSAAASSPTGLKRKMEEIDIQEVPSADAPSTKKKR